MPHQNQGENRVRASSGSDEGTESTLPAYYSHKVLDHFYNPRNCGEIVPADGTGIAEAANRGIVVKFTVKAMDGVIADIKFKTFGCVTSIASASITTEMAKGKTPEEALALSYDDISKALGGVPREKHYCCRLTISALRDAIEACTSKDLC
jgi:nitrogen fixation NifU-like protein